MRFAKHRHKGKKATIHIVLDASRVCTMYVVSGVGIGLVRANSTLNPQSTALSLDGSSIFVCYIGSKQRHTHAYPDCDRLCDRETVAGLLHVNQTYTLLAFHSPSLFHSMNTNMLCTPTESRVSHEASFDVRVFCERRHSVTFIQSSRMHSHEPPYSQTYVSSLIWSRCTRCSAEKTKKKTTTTTAAHKLEVCE